MIIEHTPVCWKQRVKPGDVVAFKFPHAFAGVGHPKVRPSLVVDTTVIDGQKFAHVCYGTKNTHIRSLAREFIVDVLCDEELMIASLHQPTRFYGARKLIVSLDNSGFAVSREKNTAVLGSLSGKSLARLNTVRARLDAQRAVFADRRRSEKMRPSAPSVPEMVLSGEEGRSNV